MPEDSRRRVTYPQLECLFEFLNENRDIATGYNKTASAREIMKRMWQKIAQTLNTRGHGAVKDWKGWSKYWNDYKSKLKKSITTIKESQQCAGGPLDLSSLCEIQIKFLGIMGETFGPEFTEVKIEPFEEVPVVTVFGVKSEPVSDSSLEDAMSDVSSSPLEAGTSRQQSPPTNQPQATRAPIPRGSVSSLHLSRVYSRPHRQNQSTMPRRVWRRVPPAPQTSRSLIDVMNQRSQIDQTRNEIMQQLVQELRELKEILKTRLPLPASTTTAATNTTITSNTATNS